MGRQTHLMLPRNRYRELVLELYQKTNAKPHLLAFLGHHRCATTWISTIIQQICIEIGLNYAYIHNPQMIHGNLEHFIKKYNIQFLAYVNADYEYVKHLKNFRGFHVIRDPRDIVVSAYFSHLYSHSTEDWPELAVHRKALQSMSQDEGLIEEIKFRKRSFTMMQDWDYSLPHIMEVKMEDLIVDPDEVFMRIFHFLGLVKTSAHLWERLWSKGLFTLKQRSSLASPLQRIIPLQLQTLPRERILSIVAHKSFARLSGGRQRGEENTTHHYRKGAIGDWKNYFKKTHKDFFKKNYAQLLITLGYESDNLW